MGVPEQMTAVRINGHGGPEVLEVARVPVPVPEAARAQEELARRRHVGKLVMHPRPAISFDRV